MSFRAIVLACHTISITGCLIASCLVAGSAMGQASPPNVLIITVDDMSADSLGVYGCKLAGTSPNIDAFAKTALRFQHAHVQVGNCMPGRNLMWSGMFAHANGVEGFVQNTQPDYPVLCDLAKQAGYFTAIRGKASHSTPYHPYPWDANLDTSETGERYAIKDAVGYGQSARRGIEMAQQAGKPFCLMVNISDPHKPFYAQGKRGETIDDPHVPSRVFASDEVPVPGFLPDDEVIRKELAHYYCSVRRADDCFAEVILALEDSGESDNTLVMFLSDHGMPFPFAKTQLYHHSTRTPLMVRWPSVTKPDSKDDRHMVSAIDFLPTLLEIMQHDHPTPERLHGRSFAALLRGQPQSNRDHVILQYNENSGRSRHPMRGIQTREHLYLYNAWSDGQRKFATATTGTQTYRQMVKRAAEEPEVAKRLELFDHRVLEELYEISHDPDCLTNLIESTWKQETLTTLRATLSEELRRVDDPLAPLLDAVKDHELRISYMEAEDERSRQARAARRKKSPNSQSQRTNDRKKLGDVIAVEVPAQVNAGGECRVVVNFDVPTSLGQQAIHVTLKQVPGEGRIERQVKQVEGKGQLVITFQLPPDLEAERVRVAAFLGEDYSRHLQHLHSDPIPVQKSVATESSR